MRSRLFALASRPFEWLADRGWLKRRTTQHATRQVRIVLCSAAICIFAGMTQLPLPLEDAYRGVRSLVRLHPADGQTVVVAIDLKTRDELGTDIPPRTYDAQLIDRLFAAGAKRVFFDRFFTQRTTPADDEQLAMALDRHKGRVFLAASSAVRNFAGQNRDRFPLPEYAASAEPVLADGDEGPFGLSTLFPLAGSVSGHRIHSMSARLAGVESEKNHRYRPDFAIDCKTIPTLSYVDIIRDKDWVGRVDGRDIIVSPSMATFEDYHPIALRDQAPGVYFHVIGAETLKRGIPVDLGWMPLGLVGFLLIAAQAAAIVPNRWINRLFIPACAAAPFALDGVNIGIDIMPAIFAFIYGSVRLSRLSTRTYHDGTSLQRKNAIKADVIDMTRDVIALKVRNFANISATMPADDVRMMLEALSRKIHVSDEGAEITYDKDTFIWTRPAIEEGEREGHLLGLHALFRSKFSVGERDLDLAVSIGLDANHEATIRERIEDAVQCAEDAAHEGTVFKVATKITDEDRAWRLQILAEFDKAIGRGEVDVLFQPKISLSSGRILGAEALIRWQHPTKGRIDPTMLISAAEEHNRVDRLTSFVLNRALREVGSALEVDRNFKLAVNISTLNLTDEIFIHEVEHIIAAYQVSPANVIFEITETAPIMDNENARKMLDCLTDLGIRLSIDDFGTGRATLDYLRNIPSEEVKIDRSFVTHLDISPPDRALVAGAISMAHSLGRTVVAEGVETQSVAALLREMGCDEAQGYYYSPPITMAALVPRLGATVAAA